MTRIDDLLAARVAIGGLASNVPASPDMDRQAAWFREMQRAQSEAWLSHSLLTRSGVTVSSSPAASAAGVGSSTQNAAGEQRGEVERGEVERMLETDRRVGGEPRMGRENTSTYLDEPQFERVPTGLAADAPQAVTFFPPGAENLLRTLPAPIMAPPVSAPQSADAGSPVTHFLRAAAMEAPLGAPVTTMASKRSQVEQAISDEVAAYDTRTGSHAAAERASIQVTAQWRGNSVVLWLGVSQPQYHDVPGLVRRLRALMTEQGVQLASIVCNGKPWNVDGLNEVEHAPISYAFDLDSLE